MVCKKCNGRNIQVQRVSVTKRKKKGIIYWLFFGWLVDVLMWLFLTLPRLIWAIIRPKRTKTKIHSEAVCQDCGYAWKI